MNVSHPENSFRSSTSRRSVWENDLSSSQFGPVQSSMPDPIRLVLVGRTGAGKSATGNTILGKTLFESKLSMSSVTTECKMESGMVQGQNLLLIDTPGWFDTSLTENKVQDEVIKGMAMCRPGPHAFLLIIPIARFTSEQQQTVEMFQEAFQENITEHTIIIFTHEDLLEGKPIKTFIAEQDEKIRTVVKQFGSRFLAFNNKDPKNQDQVTQLLEKLEELLAQNGYSHFTNQKTQTVDKAITILEEKQEAMTEEIIKRAKQEVRNRGEERRNELCKAFEEYKKGIQQRILRTKAKIEQINADITNEARRQCPNSYRLNCLRESRRTETIDLQSLREEEVRSMELYEEELRNLQVCIEEEEQRTVEDEIKKASKRSRWYQDPFYFNILKYLLAFMSGTGFGLRVVPMALGLMAPAAAPVGLTAALAAMVGPQLAATLMAAAGRAATALMASQCSIQ